MVPVWLGDASLVLFYPSQSTKRSCDLVLTMTLLQLLIFFLMIFPPISCRKESKSLNNPKFGM